MNRQGYILLQISAYFILFGGCLDIAMTYFSNTIPPSHLAYLQLPADKISNQFKVLDNALLRAIGGCLIAIAVGALTIIYTFKGNKYLLYGLVSMVTIAEGINASQMIYVHSVYFIFPVVCVALTWAGFLFFIIKK
jgi:hypothetical protein